MRGGLTARISLVAALVLGPGGRCSLSRRDELEYDCLADACWLKGVQVGGAELDPLLCQGRQEVLVSRDL